MQTDSAADIDIDTFIKTVFGDKPFFEGRGAGAQSAGPRHIFMIAALNLVVNKERPIRMLEIGSWIGCSALTFCEGMAAAPKGGSILCVDPWESYIAAADIPKSDVYYSMDQFGRTGIAYRIFLFNTQYAKPNTTIRHIRGRSADVLPTLVGKEEFDMIYIDGNHHYDPVCADLRMCDRLLREGGILCGDDLELQIGEFDVGFAWENAKIDYPTDPKSGKPFHPGVSLAVGEFFGRRISAYVGFWAVKKVNDRYEDVALLNLPTMVPSHIPENYKEMCRDFLIEKKCA